jgi:hypothetical protein
MEEGYLEWKRGFVRRARGSNFAMREEELGLPPDMSPDTEGIPETVEGPPPRTPGEMADQALPLPGDEPKGAYDNVTAAEHLEGDSHEERISREQPDVLRPDPDHAGRLIEPESGVDQIDTTKEEVAFRAAEPGLSLSSEEEAVRIERES